MKGKLQGQRWKSMNDEGVSMVDGAIGLAIGLVVLVAIFSIAPILGAAIDATITLPGNTQSTGVFTYTGIGVVGETINISTETYTVVNKTAGVPGSYEFGFETGTNNASTMLTDLVRAIGLHSALVTAVNNGDNSTTITSVSSGANVNYATTENQTNGAFSAGVMSGGTAGSQWDSDVNPSLTTGADLWTQNASLLALGVMVSILSLVIFAIMAIRGRQED